MRKKGMLTMPATPSSWHLLSSWCGRHAFPNVKQHFRHLADRIRGVYDSLFHESDNFRTMNLYFAQTLEALLGLDGPFAKEVFPQGRGISRPGRVFRAEALMKVKPAFSLAHLHRCVRAPGSTVDLR